MDGSGHPKSLQVLPRVEGGHVLARASWSADGRSLAGMLLRRDESPVPGIVLWSLADSTYRRLNGTGKDPQLLRNGRQIVFLDRGAVQMIDTAGGEARTVLPRPPHSSYV